MLDHANRPARKPSVWFAGSQYTPDKKTGILLLPFSNQPGNQPVVLTDGDFSTLDWLRVPAENYQLTANFHIDLTQKEIAFATFVVATSWPAGG